MIISFLLCFLLADQRLRALTSDYADVDLKGPLKPSRKKGAKRKKKKEDDDDTVVLPLIALVPSRRLARRHKTEMELVLHITPPQRTLTPTHQHPVSQIGQLDCDLGSRFMSTHTHTHRDYKSSMQPPQMSDSPLSIFQG